MSELVAPLAVAANIPNGRLNVHIVRSDDFNAFVMGGEDVYIYTGLLTRIETPDALQAVIAHELGHTLGGHMAQMSDRMNAEMTRAMLIQALGIGLMAIGGDPSLGRGYWLVLVAWRNSPCWHLRGTKKELPMTWD